MSENHPRQQIEVVSSAGSQPTVTTANNSGAAPKPRKGNNKGDDNGGKSSSAPPLASSPAAATRTPQEKIKELERRATAGDLDALSTVGLAQQLSETNVLALYRFVHLFGRELIEAKVKESRTHYEAGQKQGPGAYAPSESGTLFATHTGRPRTPGGIFFFLMRQHAAEIGLNFEALYIPKLPPFSPSARTATPTGPRSQTSSRSANPEGSKELTTNTNTNPPNVKAEPSSGASASLSPGRDDPKKAAVITARLPASAASNPNKAPTPITAGAPGQSSRPLSTPSGHRSGDGNNTNGHGNENGNGISAGEVKAGRAKVTVIGTVAGRPKLNPQNQVGLVELVIQTEMSQSLPKGLPNLGATRVVVWCSEKQYNKIKDSLTPQSRLIVEGEAVAAVGADFVPFIRVVCLRLTTVELDQARRASNPCRQ